MGILQEKQDLYCVCHDLCDKYSIVSVTIVESNHRVRITDVCTSFFEIRDHLDEDDTIVVTLNHRNAEDESNILQDLDPYLFNRMVIFA
ncbi:hypothetical protein TetV_110 [Tetraselmis virus 1]|uniref:Uncharacterized protein n=1 Tax=Tetraselmis virus 1 TaxID=2060617 RepID=A0A2P0VMS6_9VIRU|nr:hypothetical protein QJ968_gp110 [Tetraselmis virus 1]AUF82202.1 hypothetical protein TetV_110 [Tetraselmis virus 1]